MNEMQLQMWTMMMGAANSFAAACASAVDANVKMQRGAWHAWSGAEGEQQEVEGDQPAFSAFEFPKQGGSWYRAPFEHPVLAFWDQVFQPWRTYWPGGGAMFQSPEQALAFGFGSNRVPALDAVAAAFSFAPWMNHWAGVFSNPQWSFQPFDSPSAEQTAVADRPIMPGFAIAKVRFADDTEVTMTIPLMAPFFASAYLPTQGAGERNESN